MEFEHTFTKSEADPVNELPQPIGAMSFTQELGQQIALMTTVDKLTNIMVEQPSKPKTTPTTRMENASKSK